MTPKPERNSLNLFFRLKMNGLFSGVVTPRTKPTMLTTLHKRMRLILWFAIVTGNLISHTGRPMVAPVRAFRKELIAPCDGGEVVLVVDGIKDNVPGQMNAIYVPGNTVVIKGSQERVSAVCTLQTTFHCSERRSEDKTGSVAWSLRKFRQSQEPHLSFPWFRMSRIWWMLRESNAILIISS